jgi:hypothetical protein
LTTDKGDLQFLSLLTSALEKLYLKVMQKKRPNAAIRNIEK